MIDKRFYYLFSGEAQIFFNLNVSHLLDRPAIAKQEVLSFGASSDDFRSMN